MDGENRRRILLKRLSLAQAPLSAAALARELSVSRQIIVGDVALLRARGTDILATPRGYRLSPGPGGVTLVVACRHTPADTRRELELLVDEGAEVVDVQVDHPVYGQLIGRLHLRSRYDVKEFLTRCEAACPLSALTGGVHLHTLRASDAATLERAKSALKSAGFLLEEVETESPAEEKD